MPVSRIHVAPANPSYKIRQRVWTDRSSGSVVWGSLYWVLRVSQLVGVAPLKFNAEGDHWYITVSPTLSFFNRICIFFLTIGNVSSAILLKYLLPGHAHFQTSYIANLLMTSKLAIVVFGSLIATLGALNRQKEIIKFLNQLYEISKALSGKRLIIISSEKLHTAGFVIFCLLTIFNIGVEIALRLESINDFNSKMLYLYTRFIFHSSYAMIYHLIMQFIFVTIRIRSTLKLLNDRLHHIYLSNKSSIEVKNVTNVDTEAIRDINELYHYFPTMIRQLDSTFGLPIILQTLVCLINMVIYSYLMISEKLNDTNENMLFSWLNHIILHFLLIMVMMETYNGLFCEWARIRREVGLLTSSCGPPASKQLAKFQLSLRLSDVTMHTMKLHSLSRTATLGKCSNVAAYILMMASFKEYKMKT